MTINGSEELPGLGQAMLETEITRRKSMEGITARVSNTNNGMLMAAIEKAAATDLGDKVFVGVVFDDDKNCTKVVLRDATPAEIAAGRCTIIGKVSQQSPLYSTHFQVAVAGKKISNYDLLPKFKMTKDLVVGHFGLKGLVIALPNDLEAPPLRGKLRRQLETKTKASKRASQPELPIDEVLQPEPAMTNGGDPGMPTRDEVKAAIRLINRYKRGPDGSELEMNLDGCDGVIRGSFREFFE